MYQKSILENLYSSGLANLYTSCHFYNQGEGQNKISENPTQDLPQEKQVNKKDNPSRLIYDLVYRIIEAFI